MNEETNGIIAILALIIGVIAIIGVAFVYTNMPEEVSLVGVKSDIINLKSTDLTLANSIANSLNNIQDVDIDDIEYDINKLFDDFDELEDDFDDVEDGERGLQGIQGEPGEQGPVYITDIDECLDEVNWDNFKLCIVSKLVGIN